MSLWTNEAEVLQALVAREPIFHRAKSGTAREDFARMTALDFWEVGASGRVYSREWVLNELERRRIGGEADGALAASESGCRRLGESCWLLTYELLQDGVRRTRRATIWEWVEGE